MTGNEETIKARSLPGTLDHHDRFVISKAPTKDTFSGSTLSAPLLHEDYICHPVSDDSHGEVESQFPECISTGTWGNSKGEVETL